MFRFAWGNLRSRPVRSTLSLLGLTVAIAGMVGLFSIAGGIDHLVGATFELIPGILVQQRGAPVPLFSTLPADWEDELKGIEGVRVVNPEVLARVNVIDGKTIISPPRFFLGVDIESRRRLEHSVYHETLEAGRFLEPGDAGTFRAVVARQIADEFGKGLGDTLRANGYDIEIVGIYYSGSMLVDVSLVMDIAVVRRIARYDPDSVSTYYIETTGEEPDDVVCRRIEEHFAGRRLGSDPLAGLGGLLAAPEDNPLTALFRDFDESLKEPAEHNPGPEDRSPGDADPAAGTRGTTSETQAADEVESPVEARSADDWADRFDDFTADLDLFLTLMTGIGVLIAVLSIVNTMLMSVTERRIEFGILRANGWSRRDVLSLVTFESALLGVGGGVLGAFVGWCATHVINWSFPDRVSLYAGPELLAFSLAFSTLLGILGGVYPAWTAARLSPMEAIRRG